MTRLLPQMLLMLIWLFSSCTWGATEMTVPVKEAPVPSDGAGPRWLDDDHVMFRAFLLDKSEAERTYVWDIRRDMATAEPRFARGWPGRDPDTGVIRYGGMQYENYDLFEQGKGIPLPPPPSPGTIINQIDGRPAFQQPPPWVVPYGESKWKTSTSKIPLKEEDGYIDRGPDGMGQKENFPIVYHRTGIAEPIPLGLGSQQVQPRVTYLPFARAYLLEGDWSNGAYPLWLLFPDGKLQNVFNPEGKPWKDKFGSLELFTKQGVVFIRINYSHGPLGVDVRDSGLYLLIDGAPKRVVEAILAYPCPQTVAGL